MKEIAFEVDSESIYAHILNSSGKVKFSQDVTMQVFNAVAEFIINNFDKENGLPEIRWHRAGTPNFTLKLKIEE